MQGKYFRGEKNVQELKPRKIFYGKKTKLAVDKLQTAPSLLEFEKGKDFFFSFGTQHSIITV